MSMTDDLLFIKHFHRRRAQTALQHAYAAMIAARDAEVQAQHASATFNAHAAKQEHAMFAGLCARQVHVRDLLDANQSIAGLRAQQREHADAVKRAGAAHDKAREARAASAGGLHQAERVVTKFDELLRKERAQRMRALEASEEREFEDVVGRAVGGREREDGEIATEVGYV